MDRKNLRWDAGRLVTGVPQRLRAATWPSARRAPAEGTKRSPGRGWS